MVKFTNRKLQSRTRMCISAHRGIQTIYMESDIYEGFWFVLLCPKNSSCRIYATTWILSPTYRSYDDNTFLEKLTNRFSCRRVKCGTTSIELNSILDFNSLDRVTREIIWKRNHRRRITQRYLITLCRSFSISQIFSVTLSNKISLPIQKRSFISLKVISNFTP